MPIHGFGRKQRHEDSIGNQSVRASGTNREKPATKIPTRRHVAGMPRGKLLQQEAVLSTGFGAQETNVMLNVSCPRRPRPVDNTLNRVKRPRNVSQDLFRPKIKHSFQSLHLGLRTLNVTTRVARRLKQIQKLWYKIRTCHFNTNQRMPFLTSAANRASLSSKTANRNRLPPPTCLETLGAS